jgi:hypothetical protein
LDSLEQEFSTDEIDDIIKKLPNDKSPSPDGFSKEFIKKCWPTINNDFYELCWAFHNNNVRASILPSSPLYLKLIALLVSLISDPFPFSIAP